MSVGICALKVGLVTTVAGISVATPILLRNKRSLATEVTQNVETSSGGDLGEDSSAQELIGGEEAQRTSEVSVASETPSFTPLVKKEEFGKKCFIVPARENGGKNIQLLTCYEEKKIREDFNEDQAEYESLFHVYDQIQKENPIEIKSELLWNPKNQQLVAKLSSPEKTYTFTAAGKHWGGISPSNKSINLAGSKECAIYEAKLKDSTDNSTHLLTCGNDISEFTKEEPKGIPLTNWELKR